jgi:pimeloyl-ACP methyl ester carboxylesterase
MSFNISSFTGLGALLLIGLVIAIITMTIYTIYILTHPPRRTYASALARGRPGEPAELDPGPRGKRPFTSWTFQHQGLDLPVWDIQGDKPDGPIFILSHGWGDSRIGGLTRTPALATHASRLILWDMPGHGEAKGTCALGTREVDALLTLIDRVGAPVVLFGWSLGAGVSIAAAAREAEIEGVPARSLGPSDAQRKITAVIAEAPYRLPWTPARNVLASFGLPFRINLPLAMGFLGMRFGLGPRWPGFDRAQLAAKLRSPLLVIHGALDAICPVEDGRDIANAAPKHELLILDNGAHHSIWTDPQFGEPCAKALERFLASMP